MEVPLTAGRITKLDWRNRYITCTKDGYNFVEPVPVVSSNDDKFDHGFKNRVQRNR